MMKRKQKIKTKFYCRPGLTWSDEKIQEITTQMRGVVTNAVGELPLYQCLTGERKYFANVYLALSYNSQGQLVGFCSSPLFKIRKKFKVLHMGLTCVDPKYQGLGLTHKLGKKVILSYYMRNSLLFKPIWVSNLAAVLSSLGNFGKYFEEVYPSPKVKKPTKKHQEIAFTIAEKYRDMMYIDEHIAFDKECFNFRKSTRENMFYKNTDQKQYFHRNNKFNEFYLSIMNLDDGDEILQIGKCNPLSAPKHSFKKKFYKLNKFLKNKKSNLAK